MIHLHVSFLQEVHYVLVAHSPTSICAISTGNAFCIGRSLVHFHLCLEVRHGRRHRDERLLLLVRIHARAERRDERARIALCDVHIHLTALLREHSCGRLYTERWNVGSITMLSSPRMPKALADG